MKSHPRHWLKVRPEGLYCEPGQFYIDPNYPVEMAVVTHGHADHARPGNQRVLATPDTLAIMATRYGNEFATQQQPATYGEKIIHNEVSIKLIPAGHILGSAQAVLEYQGAKVIISGDYKRTYDPTCLPFEVETCDVFITEATFALPIFKHPPIKAELNRLITAMQAAPERAFLLGSYALGKCQNVLLNLRECGYEDTIYLHGALLKLTHLYASLGFNFGDLKAASDLTKATSAGKLILCPPSALHDRWSRRFANPVVCTASGWMQVRARAKQGRIEFPLVISDHADWPDLNRTILEVNPEEVWVTHGREEALVYQAIKGGYKAQALSVLGFDEGNDES